MDDSLDKFLSQLEEFEKEYISEAKKLRKENWEEFVKKYCDDCVLGDHAGCNYCEYK